MDQAVSGPQNLQDSGISGSASVLEGKRHDTQFVVVSMCVGGGVGAAGLFEVAGQPSHG
ncbi:thiolase [Glutamicibacter soli]|uniref:Thiolase n=1 Tax=Glutamicibacter soli TaxID=453836 RepID=A0A365YH61_9MICC|nr:thiolase [Glutamicibacter soli]